LLAEKIYKVSEITRQLRTVLEDSFPEVWVEGEISNFKEHTSGHLYFSLKDDASELKCVMFRGDAGALSFAPTDGMKVKAYGRITVYEKRGYYQLQVLFLLPGGVGELAIAFEMLKKKLLAEGLFAEEHKKSLPEYPMRIGVVTAPTGAVIRDIINILGRRWPVLTLVLRPARVQGDGAAETIAQAIDDLNEYGEVDVIIVGRGGGSAEDLWPFNEEIVARAIYRSAIPVISAVGHEVDYTIADFVADVRAPTPSAAAEIVAPDRDEVISRLENSRERALRAAAEQVSTLKLRLKRAVASYGLRRPQDLIAERWQNLDDLERRRSVAVSHRLEMMSERLAALEKRSSNASPRVTLARGYCICRKLPGEELVKKASMLRKSDPVSVEFGKGSAQCVVEEVKP
jgi:exodeoxyribonuclease VII large subunit